MKLAPSPHGLAHALTHVLALASLLLAPASGWAAPGPQAGVSAAVRGSVLLGETGHPGAVGRAVADGDGIYLGNAIKAGPAAGMQLMLLDQTTVTLGENTELAVDEFIYDPARNNGQISMKLTKGAFRLVTGGVSDINPANTRIRTPTATIGIRGTIVLANVSAEGTLIALGGPGPNADSRDRVGAVEVNTPQGSVSITRPGFATFVANGQAPETPRPLTTEESASLSGGLAKDGSSSSESGPGKTEGENRDSPPSTTPAPKATGSTTEEGATQATEAAGTGTAEAAVAATVVSTQVANTTTAADQTSSNTQSSEYGSTGTQLTSNAVVQTYLAQQMEEEPAPAPSFSMPGLPAVLSPFSITRDTDVASLSGYGTYNQSGVALYDFSTLGSADLQAQVFGGHEGLAQVGSYDFAASLSFAERKAYVYFSNISLPGDSRRLGFMPSDGFAFGPTLAYGSTGETVYDGDTPTDYVAAVGGAVLNNGTAIGDSVWQGLLIGRKGGTTPLYGGSSRVARYVPSPPPVIDQPMEKPPAIPVAETLDLSRFTFSYPASLLMYQINNARTGTTGVYSQTGVPIAALGGRPGTGTYDLQAHVNFTTLTVDVDFTNIDLGDSQRRRVVGSATYDADLAPELTTSTVFGLNQPLATGPANERASWQVTLLDGPGGSAAGRLAHELFIAAPGTTFHGSGTTQSDPVIASNIINPYDIARNPGTYAFHSAGLMLNGQNMGTYDYDAYVDFNARQSSQTVSRISLPDYPAVDNPTLANAVSFGTTTLPEQLVAGGTRDVSVTAPIGSTGLRADLVSILVLTTRDGVPSPSMAINLKVMDGTRPVYQGGGPIIGFHLDPPPF